MSWLVHLNQWHWLGLAAILLVLEVLSGTGFLFWVGMAAALTGVIVWLLPAMVVGYQGLIFAASSLLLAVAWWCYSRRNPPRSDKPLLNRRGEQYIGRRFTLETPVEHGRGKINVDDSVWRIACDQDLAIGAKVVITASDGVLLHAEAVTDA